MKIRKKISLLVLLSTLLVPTLVQAVDFPQYAHLGTVRDASGNPLAGVRVTNLDAGSETQTDAEGRYRLEEDYAGFYSLLFSKYNMEYVQETRYFASEIVIEGQRVFTTNTDVTMMYWMNGYVSPGRFQNDGQSVIQITATTYGVPDPKCAYFVDEASATQIDLAATQSGTRTTWTGSFNIPADRAPGSYGYSLRGTDCGDVTTTTVVTSNYLITES